MRCGLPVDRHRGGFSIVEAAVSVLLVGGLLVAALTAVGASQAGRAIAAERAQGRLLAQGLMAEILAQPYGGDTLGLEGDEGSAGTRAGFDDADDYRGWQASPPQRPDGTPLEMGSDWDRRVEVVWVRPAAPEVIEASPTGAKRVTVTVRHRGRIVATLAAVRTSAWPTVAHAVETPQ